VIQLKRRKVNSAHDFRGVSPLWQEEWSKEKVGWGEKTEERREEWGLLEYSFDMRALIHYLCLY
jgi:hypothetical protein